MARYVQQYRASSEEEEEEEEKRLERNVKVCLQYENRVKTARFKTKSFKSSTTNKHNWNAFEKKILIYCPQFYIDNTSPPPERNVLNWKHISYSFTRHHW